MIFQDFCISFQSNSSSFAVLNFAASKRAKANEVGVIGCVVSTEGLFGPSTLDSPTRPKTWLCHLDPDPCKILASSPTRVVLATHFLRTCSDERKAEFAANDLPAGLLRHKSPKLFSKYCPISQKSILGVFLCLLSRCFARLGRFLRFHRSEFDAQRDYRT